MRGVFVTGTDTGVGKTLAACVLVHALRGAGRRHVPMKAIAAAREGRTLTLDFLQPALERLAAAGDFVVAEGVGGFKVPLAEGLDTVDLARALGLPVVLVVGLRLGCLNHALLTADAVRAAGLPLAGWIANAIDPDMPVRGENVAALAERLGAPLVGELPYDPMADARALATRIDTRKLLAASLSRP